MVYGCLDVGEVVYFLLDVGEVVCFLLVAELVYFLFDVGEVAYLYPSCRRVGLSFTLCR